jgi:hypothetical protein
MIKSQAVTPELSLRFRESVAECLLEIASRYFQHGDELAEMGFNAFIAYVEYEFSACDGEDRERHKLFLVEEAKEIIGTWGPMPPVLHEASAVGYRSPVIEALRTKRKEDGYDRESYKKSAESWKYYLSPCRIELHRISRIDPARGGELLELRNRSRENARRLEVAKFALEQDPGLTDYSRLNYKEQFRRERARLRQARQVCSDIAERELHFLGFKRSAKLSSSSAVFFVLAIKNDWHLRFVLEFGESNVRPHMHFCHSSVPRRTLKGLAPLHDPRRCMEIRFDYSAPFFYAAYSYYRTQSELEVNVRAILALHRLEHECILEILENNLELR